MTHIEIAALYHFAPVADREALKAQLQACCTANGMRGILLIAHEGINGTVAGTPEAIATLLATIRAVEGFAALEHKTSYAETMPFHRMKVRLKAEIVTLKQPDVDPSKIVGTYVDPRDWNALISDPDVVVLDTRNSYECDIGTFKHALNPQTETFCAFPEFVKTSLDPKKHKKVAMFCTGGIRCEKASSYMKLQGFEEVYHLKGGILKYLEDVPKQESLWEGACFVFDSRVAVEHELKISDHSLCYGCRHPLTSEDYAHPQFETGVCCPHCADILMPAQKSSARERMKQVELAQKRGVQHIGQHLHSNPTSGEAA
jgi:UPF0176 protein